ncbi:hypothetical protein ACP70R_001796 [Stipagrostis hirtigluma subsp. patula]
MFAMGGEQQGGSSNATESRSAAGFTAFALRLIGHLAGGSNLVFSPLSVYSALALVASGARGRTLQELLDALGAATRGELAGSVRGVAERALADRSASGGPTVAFAGGVWHDAAWALRPGFREAAAASYKAEALAVDFRHKPGKAIRDINRWVAAATNNLIGSIVEPTMVHEELSLVLASAIYFKGKWETPFAKRDTTVGEFHLLGGGAVEASFLSSGRDQLIAVHDGFKVLELPYRSSPPWSRGDDHLARYSMCVFLPDARDGLPALVERIASGGGLRDHLPRTKVRVGEFRLPKFKLSFSGSLLSALRDKMGIKAAFDEEQADLFDMARCRDDPSSPLFVGEVSHKAVLEVNEEGTVATATTTCYMMGSASGIPLYEWLDDRLLAGLPRWLGRVMGLGSCI